MQNLIGYEFGNRSLLAEHWEGAVMGGIAPP